MRRQSQRGSASPPASPPAAPPAAPPPRRRGGARSASCGGAYRGGGCVARCTRNIGIRRVSLRVTCDGAGPSAPGNFYGHVLYFGQKIFSFVKSMFVTRCPSSGARSSDTPPIAPHLTLSAWHIAPHTPRPAHRASLAAPLTQDTYIVSHAAPVTPHLTHSASHTEPLTRLPSQHTSHSAPLPYSASDPTHTVLLCHNTQRLTDIASHTAPLTARLSPPSRFHPPRGLPTSPRRLACASPRCLDTWAVRG